MDIVECLHCHRRVIPSDDGICPSCSEHALTAPAEGAELCLLSLRGIEKFPNVCFQCSEPAEKRSSTRLKNTNTGKNLFALIIGVVSPVLGILTRFAPGARGDQKEYEVNVSLPICKWCAHKKLQPKIDSFDVENHEIRVLVHKQFREEFKLLNS